jgi:hypothetical protein
MSSGKLLRFVTVVSLLASACLLASTEPAQKLWLGVNGQAHAEGCPKLVGMMADPQKKAMLEAITLEEVESEGMELCPTCPVLVRESKAVGPDTLVYLDALWFRVHAEDCPELILKEAKTTMTLEAADQAGARIGESGQSGRSHCCLQGYTRQHPKKTLSDDTILCGNDEMRNYKHIAGCHRYWPERSHARRPMSEWLADGYKVCPHCIERGPSRATVSNEVWAQLGSAREFVAPEGWEPQAFATDALPSPEALEILIDETLCMTNGIQELEFTDPVASMENFVTMRFFFPVGNWLFFYKTYRSTGDERLREKLLESARHYHQLSEDFTSVAQLKASDPEGLPYMYTMAVSARITLQLVRKELSQVSKEALWLEGGEALSSVSKEEFREAEAFLETMVSVLKPTYEEYEALDPEMGIPQELADDFRFRAFNRSMNGIGTLSTIVAALEDLQALKRTTEYQPTINRYRKEIGEYLTYWFSRGHFCTKVSRETHFYYPYAPREPMPREANGCVIFKRPEDAGHYSHTLQGLMLLYEATPELGINDAFMTAVANAAHYNSTTKVEKRGERGLSGHFECPTMTRVDPYSSLSGRHGYSPARDRFYLLQAFRDDLIDGLCDTLSQREQAEVNSEYEKRVATLHAQYMKALRQDRSLVHLGEKL